MADDDKFIFAFTPVYHQTFERTRFYQTIVDYEQLPVKFETYHSADQDRIKTRMSIIQEQQRQSTVK